MQLLAKDLLAELNAKLQAKRKKLKTQPGLALVWVGADSQTAAFVRAKQRKAAELNCQFFLHHLESATERQFKALISSLNQKKEVTGIVLQLPLPKEIDTDGLINQIAPEKDVDGLRPDSTFPAPTPTGIIALLRYSKIAIQDSRTVILGGGRLVGGPLAKIFQENNWSFLQITKDAQKRAAEIREHEILIAATGRPNLVSPAMVHQDMIVIDGSGVDVDVEQIEPLVKAITPKKGAIGPLTVSFLFDNLLTASQ